MADAALRRMWEEEGSVPPFRNTASQYDCAVSRDATRYKVIDIGHYKCILRMGITNACFGWTLQMHASDGRCGWTLRMDVADGHCGWTLQMDFAGGRCAWT
eukprot:CAMPEP_0181173726 /NCGR_PEP_ID=MMETSP1096-20121128/3155_1 /TAXON_ID=156174 ORGANISM="Chrysochromulina ericina, Strain CCMP281" /NCGR_SAMPLE_ID=MMETSP1096 /ASSEMBLY_ACC=CAM_ASM_000453 /LENGTH=100 /DNA_ID=CAMNT_0023261577 /DNA_START=486 /DNA_END=788 /DNA_ORIENTATION=-